jgi:hypothetical protein
MKFTRQAIRRSLAITLFVFCGFVTAIAQDATCENPSLGDVARNTRKQNSAPGHVAAKQFGNEDEDGGPDTTGIWRMRLCTKSPCYELSVTLPKEMKWSRAKDEPRPVLISLPGQDQDKDAARVIRLFAAQLPAGGPYYAPLDPSKRLFLQSWFARPEYFGQAARFSRDEHLQLDVSSALISHFTVANAETKFEGVSVIAGSPNGNYGFACVYREQDAAAAASVCDAIVRSAHNQALEPGQRPLYPGYQPPVTYPYYPRIDDHAPDGYEPRGVDDSED